MLPLDHPDRIQITFDDRRLVANAGLLLPVTLAQHLGLRELVDHHLDLGNAPGRANPGDKMLTLVASALAGGDCIDDADVLRTGGTAQTLGCVVKAPSTLGTFLRSFRWGHVRQLDRVSRGGTRRRAIHHRPGFDDLRDLSTNWTQLVASARAGHGHNAATVWLRSTRRPGGRRSSALGCAGAFSPILVYRFGSLTYSECPLLPVHPDDTA